MNGGTSLEQVIPGLYLIGVSPSPASPSSPSNATYAYYLTQTDPPQAPTLAETWQSASLPGWYVFLTEAIGDPVSFVPNARTGLPIWAAGTLNPRAIVWLTSETAVSSASSIILTLISPAFGTNTVPATFNWNPLQLSIGTGVRVTFDTAAGVFTIATSTNNFTTVQLSYGTVTPIAAPYVGNGTQPQWSIALPLTGAGAGALATTVALDLGYIVQSFGCGFRYFFDRGEELADLYYTFVPPRAISTTSSGFLAFAPQLHPILPADPAATFFALDLGGENSSPPNLWQTNSAALQAPFFLTTEGGSFTLGPAAVTGDELLQPGFAFGIAPTPAGSPAGSPLAQTYYLTPTGTWQVASMQTPAGSPATTGSQWLCGLNAQESLELATGDLVAFAAGMPAYAPAFGSGSSPGGTALDPTFTTAWLQYPAGQAAGAYYGMPGRSIYYAAVGDEFSAPVASRLSTFPEPAVFPVVPYGGIYASASASPPVPTFNGGVEAATFAAFESLILSGARHEQATLGTTGPVFQLPNETRAAVAAFDAATPPPMPSALTPQGFVADLNDEGTWNRLYLARSPQVTADSPPQFLSFDASENGAVLPAVANILLQDQLFLVAGDAASLGAFSNRLSIEGFNFTLDVGATLLIFKYNTSTALIDLVERPDLWNGKETFTGDVAAAQQTIRNAIETAAPTGSVSSPGGGDAFANFRQLIADPSWTGILALNCAIDGNGMPPDFQMLLGGINGQLRAHHLGVARNRVRRVPGASVSLDESSLFGVIHYPAELQPPPPVSSAPLDYEVETLTVVFSNSKITNFNVVVGLTVNQLFGREVELLAPGGSIASPSNTLEIAGQYQVRGGVGVVLFNTSEPFVYLYPIPEGATRVLDRVVFESASLTPISSVQSSPDGTTAIDARFALAGGLWFQARPFPASGELDLFSYGHTDSPNGGLGFSEMTVNIAFTLDAEGAMTSGSKQVTFDPSPLQVSASPAAVRPGSLLDALPLQLSSFLYSDSGLSTSALGATPIHVLQLEAPERSASPAISPEEVELIFPPASFLPERNVALVRSPASPPAVPGQSPNVTAAPQFALEYDLPLGSLGSLSSVNAGINAKLLVGWGPSRLVPGSDAAAVLVQLPQLSAGYGGFELQGILKTTFGDANLLQVDVDGRPVYAILFNNIQLSIFGFTFPPGLIIDFLIFAGKPSETAATNTSNIAWFLGARQEGSPS
ncbi:MAG TPA: hypothetical protein VE974_14315 [Thermoanaerobaculia bacterium]|nr:hypothetical protein [Thermoanaerobaculia bacterium]